MKITIPYKNLKAASFFMSKDVNKSALQSIHLDASKAFPILVATDGVMLITLRGGEIKESGVCSINDSAALAALYVCEVMLRDVDAKIQLETNGAKKVVIQIGDVRFSFEGQKQTPFPNWSDVIPKKESLTKCASISVAPQRLQAFYDCADLLTLGKTHQLNLGFYGDLPILGVQIEGVPEFFGCLMPMTTRTFPTIPDFLK